MKFLAIVCVLFFVGSVSCRRHRRQAFAFPAAPTPKTAGMNVALGFLVGELEKEKALGGPVNPSGLQKASNLAMKIQLMGGEVNPSNQESLDSLVSEAAAQPGFAQYLSKPADTKVNVPKQGP